MSTFLKIATFALLITLRVFGSNSVPTAAQSNATPAATMAMMPLKPGDKIGTMTLKTLDDSDPNSKNINSFYLYCADHTKLVDKTYQPGTYNAFCTLPSSPALRIGPAWTAFDISLIDQNWAGLAHDLSFDGQMVDLTAFGTVDRPTLNGKAVSRSYRAMIDNLTPGKHTLHVTMRLAKDIFDGQNNNAVGIYDYTYTFLVQDCPIKLPAAATMAAPTTPPGPTITNFKSADYGFTAGYTDSCGMRIANVVMGGAAEKGGLQIDDVVVAINGTPITSRDQLLEMVKGFYVGQLLNLAVERAGELKTGQLTVVAGQ